MSDEPQDLAFELDDLSRAYVRLQAELEAARAVVAALRGIQVNWPPLTAALRNYDELTKVSSE